ncbi:MAG TPA: hypothetical protein VGL65_13930 [Gemmatimonadales bacterium]|jgi:hypothetical protein
MRLVHRLCGAAILVLVLAALGPPAAAQVPTDSAHAPSHLAVHLPRFIPFFHHRHQAGRAPSAEPDSTVLLRVETGYDGNFDSPELDRDETTTFNVDVTPNSSFELQGDIDFWALERAPAAGAVRGRGDAHVNLQWTAFKVDSGRVAVAIAYIAKIPAANQPTLGTGLVDHRVIAPVSIRIAGVEVDAYAGVDADAIPGGFDWGGEGGLSATVALSKALQVHGGASGQTVDTDQPAGGYISGGISWQARPLVTLDIGGRIGITSGTPDYGLIAGVSAAFITRKPSASAARAVRR